ncbi:hypothetical protein [Cerasicoccus maritimus]|uniref:hypothetical protein n=1 Tax=Cerasicoccus maritimus TaxID=490089 RepID=UPI002852C863|nr:hypothetical protein [Cerasicoccus maritimus]
MSALLGLGIYKNFVETGTFHGDTAEAASRHFEQTYTVEASPELFKDIQARFANNTKVKASLGDAAEWLAQLKPQLKGNSIYWLDAHWCQADNTSNETSQCPLLAELESIATLGEEDIILIDDARLFTATPAPPHEISSWPTLTEIVHGLLAISSKHQLSIINDVIFYFPKSIEETIIEYSKHAVDLIELTWKAQEYERIKAEYSAKQKTMTGKAKNLIHKIVK